MARQRRRDFNGTFRLFKTGDVTNRDLTGTFRSDLGGLNQYRFPSLYGSLRWTQHGFEIWNAGRRSTAATRSSSYSIKPFGEKTPATHRFDTTVKGVDLARFTDFEQLPGQRFAGSRVAAQSSRVAVRPLRSASRRGDDCGRAAARRRNDDRVARRRPRWPTPTTSAHEWGPFAIEPMPAHLPIARRDDVPLRAERRHDRRRTVRDRSHLRGVQRHDRRTAARRGYRFTSPAATGRRAISCSPASSATSDRRPGRCRSAGAANSTA